MQRTMISIKSTPNRERRNAMSTNKTNNLKVVDSNETEPRKNCMGGREGGAQNHPTGDAAKGGGATDEVGSIPGSARCSAIRYSQ
jgi:hypothetical protein